MSFQSQSDLTRDEKFQQRITACAVQQADIFKNDGRADIAQLATAIIVNPVNATGLIPLAAAAPDFRDSTEPQVSDGQILSVVQAIWPTYAAALYPPTPAT